jgi:hypothetical protein
MSVKKAVCGLVAAVLAFGAGNARGAEVVWGGAVREASDVQIRALAGAAFHFKGNVEETERKFYTRQGDPVSKQGQEKYDLSDFETDDLFGLAGLSVSAAWPWFRLQLDSVFMNPSIEATARRDYYLTLNDSISFLGRDYDHFMIPEGTRFDADFTGNMTELTLMFVPLSVQDDALEITPSLELGVLALGGRYEIDAGVSHGVTTYQYPPEQFVIGGHAEDWAGIGVPQWGGGVEVRLGAADRIHLDLQAHYLFCLYNGGTSVFTTAKHRNKDLDLDHRNLRLRAELRFPSEKRTWTVGVQAQFIETDGTLESSETDPKKIAVAPERFDKVFAFELSTVLATVGVAF